MKTIYLDHNASTPIHPAVAAVMRPLLEDAYGNPSSTHWAGEPAHLALDAAREQVAAALASAPDEVVFTSGGSEANNLALKGVFFSRKGQKTHIITTGVEHPAILEPCRFLESLGAEITILPVDGTGRVDPHDLQRAMGPHTALVSIMHANNEVGTIQPIRECAEIAHAGGALFHTDGAQTLGKIPTDVWELGVDFLSLAGHKCGAPKGIGALYMRAGRTLEPLIHGAGHESGRRAGTESVLLAAALGEACRQARDLEPVEGVRHLRDALWKGLVERFADGVVLNGHPEHRLPNTLNVNFVGRVGADVLASLESVAASTGSACHSGQVTLSPVLSAMGVDPKAGMGAVRFSLGRSTTVEDIEETINRISKSLPIFGTGRY